MIYGHLSVTLKHVEISPIILSVIVYSILMKHVFKRRLSSLSPSLMEPPTAPVTSSKLTRTSPGGVMSGVLLTLQSLSLQGLVTTPETSPLTPVRYEIIIWRECT